MKIISDKLVWKTQKSFFVSQKLLMAKFNFPAAIKKMFSDKLTINFNRRHESEIVKTANFVTSLSSLWTGDHFQSSYNDSYKIYFEGHNSLQAQ